MLFHVARTSETLVFSNSLIAIDTYFIGNTCALGNVETSYYPKFNLDTHYRRQRVSFVLTSACRNAQAITNFAL